MNLIDLDDFLFPSADKDSEKTHIPKKMSKKVRGMVSKPRFSLDHHPIHLLLSGNIDDKRIDAIGQPLCRDDESLCDGAVGIYQTPRHVIQMDDRFANLCKPHVDSVLGRIGKHFNILAIIITILFCI